MLPIIYMHFFVSTYLKAHTAVNLGDMFSVRWVCIYKAHALCLKTFGKLADCAPPMVSARCCVGEACECTNPEN